MAEQSPFQRLPLHVAEAVFHYCCSSHSACVNSEQYGPNDANGTCAKLYNVSQSWRWLTLKHLLKDVTLYVSTRTGTAQLEFSNLPEGTDLNSTHYSYVKQVNVRFVDVKQPSSDRTLKHLSAPWIDCLVFPSALHTRIDLDEVYSHNADDCFSWISQRIYALIPKLHNVAIEEKRSSGGYSIDEEWMLYCFLSTVLDKATNVCARISHKHLFSDYPSIQSDPGLCILKYYCSGKDSLFGYIVQASAHTLESLTIEDLDLQNARSLIFNDKGMSNVYPRLKTLDYRSRLDSQNHEILQVDKSIGTFPVLRHLRWSASYIFENDMLFRGCGNTLEYLHVDIDPYLLGILERHRVFSDSKHPQPRHIILRDIDYYAISSQLSPDMFSSFAATLLSPKTLSMSFMCEMPYKNVADIFSSELNSRNIQSFILIGTAMPLLEMLELVRMLPNMKKLCCGPVMSSFSHFHQQDHSVIDDMHSTHYPLSYQLKYWEIPDDSLGDMDLIAESTLVLATLCPNFVTALVSQDSVEAYASSMELAMAGGPYDNHRASLQRLLQKA